MYKILIIRKSTGNTYLELDSVVSLEIQTFDSGRKEIDMDLKDDTHFGVTLKSIDFKIIIDEEE